MNKSIPYLKHVPFMVKALAIATLSSTSGIVLAIEKDFADAPLFLQSGVQPNIVFAVDDSGSMGWNQVYSNAVLSVFNGLDTNLTDGDLEVTPSFLDDDETLHTCSGVNRMYYDPAQTYTPWAGEDEDGNAYRDMTNLNQVLMNPYDADGATFNLDTNSNGGEIHQKAGYYQWQDLNGNKEWDHWVDLNGNNRFDDWVDLNNNGQFDLGESEYECPVSIGDGDYIGNLDDSKDRDKNLHKEMLRVWFKDTGEMTTAERTNFGNWYSYYRKRDYVAKKALTTLVYDSVARIGLRTLHNNNSVYTAVKDIDDLSTPVNLTAKSNKETLLRQISRIRPSGGTPLRRTLQKVGQYYEGSSSPILPADQGGKCQQNFAILMTDGVWNGSNPSPSLGNVDKNSGNIFDGGTYADTYSNTLADVAMYYYKRDLRAGYPDEVPIIKDVDENSVQHMVTYTVAFGLSGTLDSSVQPTDPAFAGWPKPKSNQSSTIDDVRHAAYNGRGQYLEARDPQELISSLNQAIKDIQGRTGGAASVAVTSGSYSELLQVFQASFDSVDWKGKVMSFSLAPDGTVDPSRPSRLATVVPTEPNRNIVSWDGSQGIPFQWSNLTANQKSEIGNEETLNFVRGVYDQDAVELRRLNFRQRTLESGSGAALGDIVHASPAYVGEPEFRYPDDLEGSGSQTYTQYRIDPDGDGTEKIVYPSGHSTGFTFRRNPVLYVASNDGLVHGFNVDPDPARSSEYGKELFAFAPSAVFDRYTALTRKDYLHTYTVDGTPYAGDAYFDNEWHTVLLGGMNTGGQGIYALDVSNPNAFSSESTAKDAVLWEFTDQEDADLGFTFSRPVIAKSHALGRWVAIFGNGYNNTYSDGTVGSGTAVLYVVDIETGSLIKKIDTGVNELSTPNGLSSPSVVDKNGDYIADYVYAGDLEGNLWKFDISSSNTSSWGVSAQSGSNNIPLFTACSDTTCSLTNRQPITTQPQVSRNRAADGGFAVYFGTGSYIYDVDINDGSLQAVYGIWDRDQVSFQRFNKTHLLKQEILKEQNVVDAVNSVLNEVRQTTDDPITWHGLTGLPGDGDGDGKPDTHLGWYLSLVNTDGGNTDGHGERVIYNIDLQRGYVTFPTLIPNDDPCSSGGDGWIMALKMNNGGRADNEEPFFDVNNDMTLDDQDLVNFGGGNQAVGGVKDPNAGGAPTGCVFVTLPDGTEVCVTGTQQPDIAPIAVGGELNLGRWMWQELER